MKYKYIGKEKVEEKEYIKFSIENDGKIAKEIYYVDTQNKIMSKSESYINTWSSTELDSITSYTYSYNTVTDEDVTKFDISNYSEYERKEF